MGSPEHKEKIWNMIKGIKTGMLVTKDPSVGPHARPMQLVQDDYDGRLFFFTKVNADKVDEAQMNDAVCVSFSDVKSNTYVSMTGYPKITKDQKLIDRFWNKHVEAWFPEGKDSPEVALMEIKVEHGEHWDSTSNPIKYAYEVTKANIKDERPSLGENEKF